MCGEHFRRFRCTAASSHTTYRRRPRTRGVVYLEHYAICRLPASIAAHATSGKCIHGGLCLLTCSSRCCQRLCCCGARLSSCKLIGHRYGMATQGSPNTLQPPSQLAFDEVRESLEYAKKHEELLGTPKRDSYLLRESTHACKSHIGLLATPISDTQQIETKKFIKKNHEELIAIPISDTSPRENTRKHAKKNEELLATPISDASLLRGSTQALQKS